LSWVILFFLILLRLWSAHVVGIYIFSSLSVFPPRLGVCLSLCFFSSACIAEFECGVCGYMAFLDAVMSAGSHSAFAFVLCNVLAKAQRCSTACCEHSGVALCSQRPRHFWPLLSHGQDLCKRLVEDDTEKKTKLLSCCVMVWQQHSGVALLVASTAV
jgi:hypothetical protein